MYFIQQSKCRKLAWKQEEKLGWEGVALLVVWKGRKGEEIKGVMRKITQAAVSSPLGKCRLCFLMSGAAANTSSHGDGVPCLPSACHGVSQY